MTRTSSDAYAVYQIEFEKSQEKVSESIDSIYESAVYIYETTEIGNKSIEESETPASNKQAVFGIIRRYLECGKLNPKQRFCICVLVVILVLLIIVEVISFSFIFKQ